MELRHLRLYVTLAEELHFGRTALRLHLTQPAVSGQLRQLEDDLGVQLIRRNARQVTLTDAGRVFLLDAQRILKQAHAATGSMRRFQDGIRTSLRVGYLHDALPRRLPLALRRIAQGFPQTRILLSTGDPHQLLLDLREDLLDVAVVSLPAPVADLDVRPMEFEHAVAAVSSNLDRDFECPLELLAQRTLLTLPRRCNPAFFDGVIAGLRAAGIPASLTEIDASSVEPLLMEVAGGAGCALVPESVMARLSTPGVSFRRLTGATPLGCELAAVASWGADGTPQVAAFLRALTRPRPERVLRVA